MRCHWMPPKRQVWNDKQTQDIVEAIHAAARWHCPTSSCLRDEFRRRLAKGHWESARAMFRYDTWNEYWAWFCEDSPAIAAKIASKEFPEEAPRAFRDHQELDKGDGSCLCISCEAIQKKISMAPVEARDMTIAEIGGVAVADEEGIS